MTHVDVWSAIILVTIIGLALYHERMDKRRAAAVADSAVKAGKYASAVAAHFTGIASTLGRIDTLEEDSGPLWGEVLDLRRRVDATPGAPEAAHPAPERKGR